ncbi:MAG: SH3 domain-containing protein [Acidobacteriaceae bacterium]
MHQFLSKLVNRRLPAVLLGVALSCGLSGCSHFHHKPSEDYVYVTAKQTYLRDRVAAVSNRTGVTTNGEQLVVLERARRWLKVRTPRGEIGWIEERLTVPQDIEDKFDALKTSSQHDPVISTGATSDEAYLHVAPGRETDHLYLLPESENLQILERASVPKPITPGAIPTPPPSANGEPSGPPQPVLEDWLLVRDSHNQVGWIYGRLVDTSAPDAILRYAEGQRIVGAYVLAHVDDPNSGMLNNGATVTSIPEYVTVLAPYKSGLPFDFNQVRVFIWNVKKHRYETGFAERNILGYLPVTLSSSNDPYAKGPEAEEKLPTFTYRVLAADQPIPTPNPSTGLITPGRLIDKTYRLEGNICRRLIAPGVVPPAEAHPEPEPKKMGRGRPARRGRRR